MRETPSPEPLEPEPWLGAPRFREPELRHLARLPLLKRLLVSLMLGMVAILVAFLGLIVGGLEHWTALPITLVVMEPLALFLFLGALFCLFPGSVFGHCVAWTYRRAKPAVWLVMIAAASATVLMLGLAAWRWLKGSS